MTGWGRVPPLVRTVIRYELGVWRSLYRWILRRRPGLGPGAETFGYTGALMPILWTFIVVSAIEIPVVDLILPWETARRIVLFLGAYGLIWMLGITAGLRVHPHVVSDAGLRIRHGFAVDIALPWDAIAAVDKRRRSLPSSRTVQCERTDSGAVLHVVVLSQTNVDITLRRPVTVPHPKTGGAPVTELRCYVDDPAAFAARARAHQAARQP